MFRIISGLVLLVAVLLAGGIAIGTQWAMASLPDTLAACETEDSDNCLWDGGDNGQGRSFVVLDDQVIYLPAK